MPGLKINGTTELLLLPVCSFMEWTGTIFLYYYFCDGVVCLITEITSLRTLIVGRINGSCEEYTV